MTGFFHSVPFSGFIHAAGTTRSFLSRLKRPACVSADRRPGGLRPWAVGTDAALDRPVQAAVGT